MVVIMILLYFYRDITRSGRITTVDLQGYRGRNSVLRQSITSKYAKSWVCLSITNNVEVTNILVLRELIISDYLYCIVFRILAVWNCKLNCWIRLNSIDIIPVEELILWFRRPSTWRAKAAKSEDKYSSDAEEEKDNDHCLFLHISSDICTCWITSSSPDIIEQYHLQSTLIHHSIIRLCIQRGRLRPLQSDPHQLPWRHWRNCVDRLHS